MKVSEQFKNRISLGLLFVLILCISIYFSFSPIFKPIFILLCFALFGSALHEYYNLAKYKGFNPHNWIGLTCTFVYVYAIGYGLYFLALFFLFIFFLISFITHFKEGDAPIANLAITVFGIAYLTIPLSFVLQINYFFPGGSIQDGRLWLAYVIGVSKMTDIGAYVTGKWLGQSSLAPQISPKKTIEGAIGGTVYAIALSVLIGWLSPHTKELVPFDLSLWESLWLGFVLSILAQIGDLTESLLKRDAGVKDSSKLPGFGGFLDIVDSLVFTLPFVYLFLKTQS